MRVALFIDWPIAAFLRDFAEILGEQGIAVDLYATRWSDFGLIELARWRAGTVTIVDEGPALAKRWIAKLKKRLWRALRSRFSVLSMFTRSHLARLARSNRYDVVIGVEKGGLAMAAYWSRCTGTPYVYYSLELYFEDHPEADLFAWQRAEERELHAAAAGTIIQDAARWSALGRANGVRSEAVCLLPIGMRGPAQPKRTRYVNERFGIPEGAFVLVYFGLVSRARNCDRIIEAARSLRNDEYVVLHGPAEGDWPSLPRNVVLSTGLLPESEVAALLTSCHAGLALYSTTVKNDRLTVFSSHKVAQYLQCSLPLIAFAVEGYVELVREYDCGVLVDAIGELPQAVTRLRAEHVLRSEGASRAYAARYDLDRTISSVVIFLKDVASAGPPARGAART